VPDGVVSDAAGLAAFDGDALSAYRQTPLVCVLPRDREQVSAILKLRATRACRSCRAARAPRCRAGRCRAPTAS
jgi:hypothetical protein